MVALLCCFLRSLSLKIAKTQVAHCILSLLLFGWLVTFQNRIEKRAYLHMHCLLLWHNVQ